MESGYGWPYVTEGQLRPAAIETELMAAPFQTKSYSIAGITPEDPFADALTEGGPFQRKAWVTTEKVSVFRIGPRESLSSMENVGEGLHQWQVLQPDWLEVALTELREVDAEIAEETLPVINDAVKVEGERLIRALAGHPEGPTVYPTRDGEVAIHFKSRDLPSSVVVLLNNSGEAECYAYTDGKSRRAHYEASSDLPDAFVLQQLRALMPKKSDPNVRSLGIGSPWALLSSTFFAGG